MDSFIYRYVSRILCCTVPSSKTSLQSITKQGITGEAVRPKSYTGKLNAQSLVLNDIGLGLVVE